MTPRKIFFFMFAAGLAGLAGATTAPWAQEKPEAATAQDKAKPDPKAPLSTEEAGKIYGLALSATKFCPGGVLTDKGKAFPNAYSGEDAKVFEAQSAKIVEAWAKATHCDVNNMDPQQFSMCTIMRKRNCEALWIQVGPGGSVRPDLIDIDYSKLD